MTIAATVAHLSYCRALVEVTQVELSPLKRTISDNWRSFTDWSLFLALTVSVQAVKDVHKH